MALPLIIASSGKSQYFLTAIFIVLRMVIVLIFTAKYNNMEEYDII